MDVLAIVPITFLQVTQMTTIYGIRNCDTMKKAVALMLAQPSMIKRPVLEHGGKLTVGFKPEQYGQVFRRERA